MRISPSAGHTGIWEIIQLLLIVLIKKILTLFNPMSDSKSHPPNIHQLSHEVVKKSLDWQEAIIEGSRDAMIISNAEGQKTRRDVY